jgi:hypothetical protein
MLSSSNTDIALLNTIKQVQNKKEHKKHEAVLRMNTLYSGKKKFSNLKGYELCLLVLEEKVRFRQGRVLVSEDVRVVGCMLRVWQREVVECVD